MMLLSGGRGTGGIAGAKSAMKSFNCETTLARRGCRALALRVLPKRVVSNNSQRLDLSSSRRIRETYAIGSM